MTDEPVDADDAPDEQGARPHGDLPPPTASSSPTSPITPPPIPAENGHDAPPPAPEEIEAERQRVRRRRTLLAVFGAAVVGLVVVVYALAAEDDTAPAPKPDIPLDAWAPYWALDDSLPELEQRVGSMREVSPFWFEAVGVDTIQMSERAPTDAADEFMEIVLGHWDSWEDDAIILDKERGIFADPSKVRRLDYEGEHYRSRGPFTVPRSPQGHPVVIQAGQSERGRHWMGLERLPV